MKKYILIAFLILISCFSNAQNIIRAPKKSTPTSLSMKAGAFIDVNSSTYFQSNYSIEDLIKNVLITGGANCTANVTNVVVSPNLSANSSNRSWGYFNKGTTNFPFNDGVILMTGQANTAGNSFIASTLSGSLSTNGDADLANALNVSNNSLNDATYIQFDFVPVTNEIKFNYIFASEEYEGNYQCQFTDGFALLLKKVTDPNYTNIAVLPNNTPVSVTNIHPYVSSSCPAVNQSYFAGYNNNNIETNFAGRTIPLTATASVIPGQTYRFKMVLADYNDKQFDTGVFLQAGSFNIGVQMSDPNGNTLPSSITICEGSTQTLNASIPISGATYQWYLNNIPISGATTSSYNANTAGVYSVVVNVPNTSCPGNASITINTLPIPQASNTSLSICSSTNTATFNLTSAQSSINNALTTTFKFYTNQSDAIAGNNNFITNVTSFSTSNTTVYVRVTDTQCSAIAELDLIVENNPTAPIITASSTTICGNNSVTLTSNYTNGNTWSTGETTQSITVSSPGTYSLSYSNGNCTSSTTNIVISGNIDPNLQISGSTSFCTGSSTILTATADGIGNTYLWSNGITTPQATITSAGNYTVTVTTPSGCTFQESITITENPTPSALNTNLDACSLNGIFNFDLTSAEPNISTTPGVSFTYYTNLIDANTGNNNNITSTTNFSSGSALIYVRVSNANCYQIAQLQLNVTTTPTVVISQSAPAICGNTPVVLSSNYPTGNIWSTGETTQNITVNTTGIYSLTVSNGSCISTAVDVTIVQNNDPNLNITGNTTICQGTSTTLTANVTGTGNTFLWSNGATTQSISVSTAGVYSVTVTTPAGCQYNQDKTVTMDSPITISVTQPGQINCTNPSIVIDASASSYQGNVTILWTTSGGGNIVSGANTLTPTVNEAGTYTLTITNNYGLNCSQQQTVTVTKNTTIPNITLISSKLKICEGESITLTATGAQTYSWTDLFGNTNSQYVSPISTTTYYVTGLGANGCQGNTAEITIEVVPAINSTIQDVEFCKGDTGLLDAGVGPNYTYLWNTGETTQTINVKTEGLFTVQISNGACTKEFSANSTFTPIPKIDEIQYEGTHLTVVVKNQNSNVEYSIDNGSNWQSSNTFTNIIRNSTYYISVREIGVTCYETIEFFAYFIPNAITPNGDGINDFIDFSSISNYKNFSAIIYDRYGKEIFKASSTKTRWDGQYINNSVNTGTYWYNIIWDDPISLKTINRKGWILVKNRE